MTCTTNVGHREATAINLISPSGEQVKNQPVPPLTLCHLVTPKDDRVTALYTLCTTLLVTVARNSYCMESSAHVHGLEIRGGNFNLYKTSVGRVRIGMVGH